MRLILCQNIVSFALIGALLAACSSTSSTLTLGDRHFDAKQYEQAREQYLTALREGNPSAETYLKLAEICLQLKDFADAENYLLKALALNPGEQTRKKLGKFYLSIFKPDKAQRQYEALALDLPNDPQILNSLGVCFDQQKQHQKAQNFYREALKKDSNNTEFQSNLALSLAFTQSFDASLKILEPIALAPNATKKQRYNLAMVYALADLDGKCRATLEKDMSKAEINHFLATIGEHNLIKE